MLFFKCPDKDCGHIITEKEYDKEYMMCREIPCTCCGGHSAIQCPNCGQLHDVIWNPWIEIEKEK